MHPELIKSLQKNNGQLLYNFDQTTLSDFNDLCGDGPQQRTGLCLGLCMAWLYQTKQSNTAFSKYVSESLGSNCVRTYVNRTQHGSTNWKKNFKSEMSTISFNEFFNYQVHEDQLSPYLTPEHMPFGIIVAYNNAHSHAVSVRIIKGNVIFFDPNEGAASFKDEKNFLAWFEDYKKLIVARDFGTAYYDIFAYK